MATEQSINDARVELVADFLNREKNPENKRIIIGLLGQKPRELGRVAVFSNHTGFNIFTISCGHLDELALQQRFLEQFKSTPRLPSGADVSDIHSPRVDGLVAVFSLWRNTDHFCDALQITSAIVDLEKIGALRDMVHETLRRGGN